MAGEIELPPRSARDEWRSNGLLAFAAFFGYSFHSAVAYSAGLFMQPLTQEFGWSRTQLSAGLSIDAVVTILMAPLAGRLIDTWGTRKLAITGVAITGASVSLFGLANGSALQWILFWVIYSIVSTGIKSFVWSAGVAEAFSTARGLAFGVALCGSAFAQVVAPPVTLWLIDAFGWRLAYTLLGAGWGSLAFLVVFFFFRVRGPATKSGYIAPVASTEGMAATWKQVFADPDLRRVALSSLITIFVLGALLVHQVPMLVEAGLSRSHAAYLASLSGVAGLAGKLLTGWLCDRNDPRIISAITVSIPAVALVGIMFPLASPAAILCAMFVLGYVSGAKLQISAYLTSQYAGPGRFGTVFGIISSLVAAGSGLGPLAAGAVHDLSNSYSPFIIAAIPASLVSGLLLVGLSGKAVGGPELPATAKVSSATNG